MRISRDTLEGLISLAEKQRSSSFELEAALFPSNDVPRQTAIRVIELMRQYYVPLPISDTLDISYAVDSIRLSVAMTKSPESELSPLIKSLVGGKPPPPTKSSLISKTPVNRISIPEYSLRVHLREESKRPLKDLPSFEHAELLRFKRRYSFSVTPRFRIDITAVRTLNPKDESIILIAKKLFAAPETYEFEVEHIADTMGSESKPEMVIRNLIEHYSVLLRSVQDSHVALSAQDFENVRKLYSDISGTSTFVAPKPSTLELVHFLPDQSPSITFDMYSVTEKADGERRLLISDSELGFYSIDSRMDVHALPPELRASRPRCMLDGEHISHGGKRPDQFAIFDCYFVDGKSLLHRSLPERLDAAKAVLSGVLNDDRLFVKTFMHNCPSRVNGDKRRRTKTKSIFELSAEVLKRREIFTYRIDGLIFTPCAPPSDVTTFANWRSWPAVLKWKPPEDNTIDFMVNMLPRKRGQPYVAELMVGHLVQEGEEATRDLRSFLIYRGGNNTSPMYSNKKSIRYEHRPFAFLEPDNGAGLSRVQFGVDSPVCKNGDAIINGSVVEFAYRDKNWIPLRVRHDKTEEARHYGRITANNYKTAMNVWNSIIHPVSENMISGTEKIDETAIRKQLATSSYFAARIRPGEGGLVDMRRFHNFVKGYLISWFGKMASVDGIGPRIFDFGVGKAGDLHKWIDVGASKVVGIDKSIANLTDPINGAYSRVINLRTSQPMPETFFFEFDATSELYDPSISDPLVRSALIGIYPKGDKVARAYSGFARTGMFDMATSMFATHYFFDSVTHTEIFCRNVASVLRPGGVFVGISPDGEAIEMALNASDDGIIEGTHGDDVVWRVSKGDAKTINVFVETIGQTIPEPMLMFKELVKAMNAAGLRPLTAAELRNSGFGKYSTGMLGEFMEKLKDGQLHDVDEEIINLAKKDFNMSDDQKQYSYFNRWFAFRKPA